MCSELGELVAGVACLSVGEAGSTETCRAWVVGSVICVYETRPEALPPALGGEDDVPEFAPGPRLTAAQRAEYAEIEDGRDYDAHPLVDDPPPAVG